MTNWKFSYDVNKYVREGEPEDFEEVAKKIVNDLSGKPGFRNEYGEQLLTNLLGSVDAEDFDDAWRNIYNYADERKIWLGV